MADDPEQPVVVATARTEIEAAVIAAALDEAGIAAQVVGGLTSVYRAEAPGEVRVLVHRTDLERAREVLRERSTAPPLPPQDPLSFFRSPYYFSPSPGR